MTFLLMRPEVPQLVSARKSANHKSPGDGVVILSRTCVHEVVLNARHFAEAEIQDDRLLLRITSLNQVLELQNDLA